LEDTAPKGETPAPVFWMFTRDALERCYGVKSIRQYPDLMGSAILRGKTTVKIARNCPPTAS
jgi:hypothetical protein